MPDNFSGTCTLQVFIDGALVHSMEPNEHNQHMAGRHETGQVGYVIDESVIANLAGVTDLELRDAETNMLIYRRVPPKPVLNHAVFRLETQIFPLWRLDHAVKERFRFWYQRIEQFSAETVRQVLSFYCFDSLYSSGRVLLQNYDFYLRTHQKVIMHMQEPYAELAERLLIFHRLSESAALSLLGERDALVFEPALKFAKTLTVFDEADLRRAFGKAGSEILGLFSNPVVRQLTTSNPTEMADKNCIPHALRALAEIEIVGRRSDLPDFVAACGEMMGLDHLEVPGLEENAEVQRVAAMLRTIPWIERVIEKDLEIYHTIESAFAAL